MGVRSLVTERAEDRAMVRVRSTLGDDADGFVVAEAVFGVVAVAVHLEFLNGVDGEMIRAADTIARVVLTPIDRHQAAPAVPARGRECVVPEGPATTLRTGIAYRLYVDDAGQGEDISIKRVVHVGEFLHLVQVDFVSLLRLFGGNKWRRAPHLHRGRGLTYPEVQILYSRLPDRQNDIARDGRIETGRRDLHPIRANRQQRKVIGTIRARLLGFGEPDGGIADRHHGPGNHSTLSIKHSAL